VAASATDLQSEIEKLHDPISDITFVATGYLREIRANDPRTFTIIVEPVVGIPTCANFGDHYCSSSGSDALPGETWSATRFCTSA